MRERKGEGGFLYVGCASHSFVSHNPCLFLHSFLLYFSQLAWVSVSCNQITPNSSNLLYSRHSKWLTVLWLEQSCFARCGSIPHPHIATSPPYSFLSANFAQTLSPVAELGLGSHCSLCKALSLQLQCHIVFSDLLVCSCNYNFYLCHVQGLVHSKNLTEVKLSSDKYRKIGSNHPEGSGSSVFPSSFMRQNRNNTNWKIYSYVRTIEKYSICLYSQLC